MVFFPTTDHPLQYNQTRHDIENNGENEQPGAQDENAEHVPQHVAAKENGKEGVVLLIERRAKEIVHEQLICL